VYRNAVEVSGATILGNGAVALILDLERLTHGAVRSLSKGPRGHPAASSERREKNMAVAAFGTG
jgi:chemotaxis protein histidine kinase CheA